MLKRTGGNLSARPASDAPQTSQHLESQGYVLLRDVFSSGQIATLKREINKVFRVFPPDRRGGNWRSKAEDECFRYEMLNRSNACQRAVANAQILATIEPLLGEDCHVIANTAWRNPPQQDGERNGGPWHIDAGPHIPLAEGAKWPPSIPHPVFAIGTHIYLQECTVEDGPTGVLPGSQLSGRAPPPERMMDAGLTFRGKRVVPLLARSGDVGLFVSDVWHRRMPTQAGDRGRFFLQVHYGRRDIAQRLRTTAAVNHISADAVKKTHSKRLKTLLGLHPPGYYDG